MSEESTLKTIATHLGRLFEPIVAATSSDDAFRSFCVRLGFNVNGVPTQYGTLATAVTTALNAIDNDNMAALVPALVQVGDALGAGLPDPGGVFPPPGEPSPGRRLADLLITDYLGTTLPTLFNAFRSIGVIQLISHPAQGNAPAYVEKKVNYDEIPHFLSSPTEVVKAVFAWGAQFSFEFLIDALLQLAVSRGFSAHLERPDQTVVNGYLTAQGTSPVGAVLHIGLFEGRSNGQDLEAGIELIELPAPSPGFILQPVIPSQLDIPIGNDFHIQAKSNAGQLFGLLVRPLAADLEIKYPLAGGTPLPSASVALAFAPTTPKVLLGSASGTRLEIAGAKTTIGVSPTGQTVEFAAAVETVGTKLVVEAAEGDGFIGAIIGDQHIELPFALALRWSSRAGLSFGGSGKFEVSLTPNLELGPVTLTRLHLAVTGRPGTPAALLTQADLDISAVLGPVAVVVQEIGVDFTLEFGDGNLGIFDLDVGFKFPKGIGVFIDTGSVAGGGFLQIDEVAGRYSGALELRIYEINVKAFGLIETKVPGVSFSFVIVISAEFDPIQLGYGFMLLGIGGLVGINRSVNMDAVADAVRDGRLDHVLFPDDVIAHAPQIISDLSTLFPAAASKYVFGPMAKLTWLFLVNGTLGLLLEWPSKKVVIIGTLRAALPRPDDAIVKLKMDVEGVLDFPKKHFELNASLDPEGSSAGGYTLSGDMAMRLDWGDRPNFAISVGGFNPGYTPPPGFPILRPMAIELGIEGNPRMTVKGYMALTSNTAQVGARLDAEFHKYGADVTGYLGFDALIVFSPFKFSASLVGGVHVDFLDVGFDLTLSGTLSGPAPWRLDGEICVGVWPFEACPDFHIQLTGDPATATLPKLDPWLGSPVGAAAQDQEAPGLYPAILDLRNWQGVLDPGAFLGVTYLETGAADAKLDPVGTATFRQKAVPLNYEITRFADTTPSRKGQLKLGPVFVGAQSTTIAMNQDWFAPGRYREMSEAERLSTEAFEFLDAGVTIRSASVTIGTVAPKTINYQSFLMAADGSTSDLGLGHSPTATQLTGMATATSAARPPAFTLGAARFTDFTQARKLLDDLETYRVVNKTTLNNAPNVATSLTRSQAAATLGGLVGPALSTKQVYVIIANSQLGAA